MIDPELLAEQVTMNMDQAQDIGAHELPKPPKKGELMYCQVCHKPMYPKDFSKNKTERKYEFKWHIHWGCAQSIWDAIDASIPGLLDQRASGEINTESLIRMRQRARNQH